MTTKSKKKTSGKVASKRAKEIAAWVQENAQAWKRRLNAPTSEDIAALATENLGYTVAPNRITRELTKQGIPFKRTDADPAPAVHSKVDLLRVHVETLAKRIEALEARMKTVVQYEETR